MRPGPRAGLDSSPLGALALALGVGRTEFPRGLPLLAQLPGPREPREQGREREQLIKHLLCAEPTFVASIWSHPHPELSFHPPNT